MIGLILSFLTGGPLQSILGTIDKSIAAGVDRDKLKAEVVNNYTNAQVSVLNGRGWAFPLFFIVPVGLHFAAVCVYSVFWCKACAYPVTWSIAALPPPFDQWEGIIVTSYFIGASAKEIVSRFVK